jgi:hypothetical protein
LVFSGDQDAYDMIISASQNLENLHISILKAFSQELVCSL